jgi:hypothetical protein
MDEFLARLDGIRVGIATLEKLVFCLPPFGVSDNHNPLVFREAQGFW